VPCIADHAAGGFSIGHTIVMSRGLIDVLPDEASLAMILTHELAHIVLGHRTDTRLSFNDRLLFPDDRTFSGWILRATAAKRKRRQEGRRAAQQLPYKDKLGNAGLFLKAMHARAPELKNLISPHLETGC